VVAPTFSVQTYKPFGTPVGVSGTDQKWKYAGEVLDPATSLYYIGARYMDPELGRWLSLDPELGSMSFPQTMNRSVYCVNSPLILIDPAGTYPLGDYGPLACSYEYDVWSPAYLDSRTNYHFDWKGDVDDVMTVVGFVPGVDILSDAWFLYRAWEQGDEAGMALALGCILVPGVSMSYYRAGKVGYRYADDLLRHADDLPSESPLRGADDLPPAGNYRQRLIKNTGVDPGDAMQAHHIFPKCRRADFWHRWGIDVNDPRYGSWVDTVAHRHWSSRYNALWQDFLRTEHNSNEVFDFARKLGGMPEFEFKTFF
jgi:RHS repeat-associated protein